MNEQTASELVLECDEALVWCDMLIDKSLEHYKTNAEGFNILLKKLCDAKKQLEELCEAAVKEM